MTDKKDSLKSSVRKWLDTQGYPLEMRVAHQFLEHNFDVFQSEYYSDPESGEPREIDICAFLEADVGRSLAEFLFLIECKTTKDKPWILFTSNQTRYAIIPTDYSRVYRRIASSMGEQLLLMLARSADIRNLPLFELPTPLAYGMAQAHAKNNYDTCYSAAMSATKAALAEVSTTSISSEANVIRIAFPLIVIDGPLLEVRLDSNSNLELSEVQKGAIMWKMPKLSCPDMIIQVVTESALGQFCLDASTSIKSIIELCSTELDAEIREAQKQMADRSP